MIADGKAPPISTLPSSVDVISSSASPVRALPGGTFPCAPPGRVHRSVNTRFPRTIIPSAESGAAVVGGRSLVSPGQPGTPRNLHPRPTGRPAKRSETTLKKLATRIAAGTIGALGVAGVAFSAAGTAHAGTMPIVRPGEPTVTMTISNHTDKPEYLVGSSAAGGEWVNGPAQVLYPAPRRSSLPPSAQRPSRRRRHLPDRPRRSDRRVPDQQSPLRGRHLDDRRLGPGSQQYWINTSVATGYPQANVSYDLW